MFKMVPTVIFFILLGFGIIATKHAEYTMTNAEGMYLAKDRSGCGHQKSEAVSELPWSAILRYRVTSEKVVFLCGGVLVSNRYILTAAYCVRNEQQDGSVESVILGEWNITTTPDCIKTGSRKKCNSPREIKIDQVIVHPDYQNDDSIASNNIALVRTVREVIFTDYIKPICLPSSTDYSENGSYWLSGWGIKEYNIFFAAKTKTAVQIIPEEECNEFYAVLNMTIDDTQMCVAKKNVSAVCGVDNGGALMRKSKTKPHTWTVEGVSFQVDRCGEENLPAIYTRISMYTEWISEIINQ